MVLYHRGIYVRLFNSISDHSYVSIMQPTEEPLPGNGITLPSCLVKG